MFPLPEDLNTKWRYSNQTYTTTSQSGGTYLSDTRTGVPDRQFVATHGHPVHLLGRTNLNIGGAFESRKAHVAGGRSYSLFRDMGGGLVFKFGGSVYASGNAVATLMQPKRASSQDERSYIESLVPPVSTAEMHAAGATAISRVAPTNPLVDLSTSLAELYREGLPSLPGRGGNIGGEYLNYQFGIAPLASDIADLRQVASQSEALLAQYARNSGKHVRRRYSFPEEVSTTTQVSTNRGPNTVGNVGIPSFLAQPGTLSQTTTTYKRMWFAGAFTYHLPAEGLGRKLAELDHLYGLVPGVDTLYQLTPWSWLVDYFLNVGDVIENINAFAANGLVMPYAYVMAERRIVTRSTLQFKVWNGSRFVDTSVSDTVEFVAKRRIPATPFGFGLSVGDLTNKQWSILAALGISRR